MKRTLSALAALSLVLTSSIATQAKPMYLWDPDATKPATPPVVPPPPKPPVYHPPSPPVYHPPSKPVVPVTPVYPPTTGWYSRSVYISGYGTRYVEYRTLSSGLRTIKVWGPKGKEKLKDVNCWNNTFRAPKNKNPFRFQYETVKAVCRY